MKILLMGEYSNVHATLATGLRALGHEVTVVSNGDFWKDYPRDINLSRHPGVIGGISYLWHLKRVMAQLHGYDVVQLINPMFLELKSERIPPYYHALRRNNKRMFLGAMGMDYYWVNACVNDHAFRYSDFNIGERERTNRDAIAQKADWMGSDKERLNRMIAADCDGIISTLYEYWRSYQPYFPQKTTYIPFPIATDAPTVSPVVHSPLRVFIGINRERDEYKGTDVMLRAARRIEKDYVGLMEVVVAENVPFQKYSELMEGSDVLLDQLYSYTPAMNGLLAMSKGIICVGGGEEEHYALTREDELRPIVNVEPTEDSVYQALRDLVIHPQRVARLKRESIIYVKKHHDPMNVARRYLDFWHEHGA